ncbi:MAG: MFS transporter [Helicobacteraceae bacterium]|jgi:acyl-[acyl-carrier-protein]-phospholipid O-acyltransferase/long-chain-fatty-acid--[acyl-carrier-protein] ligase|nr:MFS transporter [Helicobacteraceae bacterium]
MGKLLKTRGFLPFLIVMFVNATVDLAHKVTILNVLNKTLSGTELIVLSAIVNAMILLPYIFLFSVSGFINDRFSKTVVIRCATLIAIALSVLVLISYINGWFAAAFVMTFLLAVQSAVYSPAKYGLIKNLVGIEQLSFANGAIQALTIVAILLSTFVSSMIFKLLCADTANMDMNAIVAMMTPIGYAIVLLSVLEAFFAFKIPFFKAEPNEDRFSIKELLALKTLRRNIAIVREKNDIWLSIIGLGIFWGVAQMLLAAFGAHYKAVTLDDDVVMINGIMAISSIGIIAGSSIAGNASKRHIELGIIPVGAIGMFLALIGMTHSFNAYEMAICSLIFGFFGGLAIVPLNSVIQYFANGAQMGKVLAANNFVQNCAMVLFLALTIILVQFNISTKTLFTLVAIIVLLAAIFAIKKMPHLFARILLFPVLKFGYKTDIQGIENIPPTGSALLLGNHISWIDWLLLQVAVPRALKFVIYKGIYDRWYLKGFLKLFDVIPISGGASRSAIENINARLRNGEIVALFPEGIISYNGQIGKFERGFELALDGVNAPIVPFYLRGLWGSTFSRADEHYKKLRHGNGKREIVIAFGEPLNSQAKAAEVKQAVIGLSLSAWDTYLSRQKPMHCHWLQRARARLFATSIIDAIGSADASNLKVIVSVLLFMKKLRAKLADQENVGVLLPPSAAGSIVNLALFAMGKKPINLNYTVSLENFKSAVEQGGIKTIISSETFEKKLNAKGFNFNEILAGRILYAESVKASIGRMESIRKLLAVMLLPASLLEFFYFAPTNLEDMATILFSSGSESAPKGVELTHKNLLANIKQVADLLNFRREDVVLNALPIFHSFGLTITTLMPLTEGILMIAVPDPTDVGLIGKMCARYNVTVLLGTSTFFRLYIKNKKLHPLMLQSVRLAIAGAEKLREDVKTGFRVKFGIEIYEGYGATETAPVVSVNMPDSLEPIELKPLTFYKEGTVGMPLPGTIVKIVDPDTLEELSINSDGLILIGGPQVMKGYYNNAAKTEEAIVRIGEWRYYKSGDKGHIDEDGFITIVDRYSRFAKIGGEMISLTSVETTIIKLFKEEIDLIAVNLPDDKKGEKIVLLYNGAIELDSLIAGVKDSALPPLMVPSEFYRVDTLPKLASGKADFKASKTLALQLSAETERN